MPDNPEKDAIDSLTRALRTNFLGHHPKDYSAAAQMLMANFYSRYAETNKRLEELERRVAHADHMLKHRTEQLKIQRKHWVRDAKKALDGGDDRALRSRVKMAEDDTPFEVVQSQAGQN